MLNLFFLGLWSLSFLVLIWGTLLTLQRLERRKQKLEPFRVIEGVSILKPLKGCDPEIEKNLKSFFELEYPDFEILFSVEAYQDPVIRVVEKLIQKYPHVRATLTIGSSKIGINPKINNLSKTYPHTQYDWVLISDSNVRVSKHYLQQLMSEITPKTGLISAVVAGFDSNGLAAHVESLHLNTFYSRSMNIINELNQPCVVGKSMLLRKSVAENWGGLLSLANYLAEDYLAGVNTVKVGYEVQLMSQPIDQFIGETNLEHFWNRHLRWGRLRKKLNRGAHLLEILFTCTVSGIFGAFAFQHFFKTPYLLFGVIHIFTWMISEFKLDRTLRGEKLNLAAFVSAWITREVMIIAIWIAVLPRNSVFWRGSRFKLQKDTLLVQNQ